MAMYQHQPLHGPRNTRLLWLEPSNTFSSPLHCRLFEVSLDENPQYEALSYCWGGPLDRTMLCYNMPLNITANCEAALRQLRLPIQPRVLWIDAICIDQSPSPEKEQHVRNMRDIYQRAGEVLVWLGEGNKSSDAVIARLLNLSRQQLYPSIEHSREGQFDLQTTGLKLFATAISWCILIVIVKPILSFCLRLPSKKKHSVVNQEQSGSMFFSFFARTVFERMWCVQEIAVARRVRIIWGKSSMDWEQLVSGLDYIETVGSTITSSAAYFRLFKDRVALQGMLRNIIYPKKKQGSAKWPPLASLLDTTRNRGATNPKDKVYALNGIFELMGISLPAADYSKPVYEIYQEITQIAFLCDQNLNMLYQVTGLPNEHNLSSWVPDLSDTKPPAILMHEAFHASRASPIHWRIQGPHNGLCLMGQIVDRIKVKGETLDQSNIPISEQDSALPSDATISAAFSTIKNWLTLAQTLPSYPTNQSTIEAFGRTLVTNGAIKTEVSVSRFLDAYNTLHNFLTTSTSADLLYEQGASNMLEDVSDIPVAAREQHEFALQIVAAILVMIIGARTRAKKRAKALHYWLSLSLRRKAFFVTEGGYMGIAPGSAAVGDAVVLFSGLATPFLMREVREGAGLGMWGLVAPGYVEGMMNGELWAEGGRQEQFVLV